MDCLIRTACLGVALAFMAAQAISWADCCCGTFCQHKNSCTGCGPSDGCPGGEQAAGESSCCDEKESSPRKTCSHLEPSSEIVIDAADAPLASAAIVEFLSPIELFPKDLSGESLSPVDTGPPRAGPPHHLALYLALSTLRI